MTLKEYLFMNKISSNKFSKKIKVSQAICCMWINNKRIPSPTNIKKIFLATGGNVSANDFYGIGQ